MNIRNAGRAWPGACALGVVSLAGSAHAQDWSSPAAESEGSATATAPPAPGAAPAPFVRPPDTRDHWYGAPMLAIDAASLGVFWGGVALASNGGSQTGPTALAWVGEGGFVLGAPIDHWAHGRVGVGFGSLALRLFVPGVLAAVGVSYAVAQCIGSVLESCSATWVIALPAVGQVGVALVDDLLLAHERVPVDASSAPAAWLRIGPRVSVGKWTTIGVGGEF